MSGPRKTPPSKHECMVQVHIKFGPRYRALRPVNDVFFAFFHYARKPASGIPEYGTIWLKNNRLILLFAEQCNRRLEFTKLMAASYYNRHPHKAELAIDDHPLDAINVLKQIPETYFSPGRPKFTREQCLVRLDLDYFYDFDFHIMQRAITNFLFDYSKEKFPQFGFSNASWINNKSLHVLLTHNCDRRLELMREFADAFLLKYPDEMLIKISDDITLCNSRAVALGPDWIDGDSEGPHCPTD